MGVAYYLGKYLVAHLNAGPEYVLQSAPGGNVSGPGVAVKLGVSLMFGNTVPNYSSYSPLTESTDITPALAEGAKQAGCVVPGASLRVSGHGVTDDLALLVVSCDGVKVTFAQGPHGLLTSCSHTFADQCEAAEKRVMRATTALLRQATAVMKARVDESEKSSAPATPPAPAPDAAPAPAP